MNILHSKKFKLLLRDFEFPFKGWDFSHVETTKRVQEYPLGWSYRSILMNYLILTEYALDMGTGGGEFLSSLFPLPPHTFATESYKPNISVAKKKLSDFNISVIAVDHSIKLPFEETFFDLVMNRHDFYKPSEVYRILKPGGYFITQQVGDSNAIELNEWFNAKGCTNRWNVEQAASNLKKCGFSIETQKEAITKTRFYDVGAVLFFLRAICWQIPNFNINNYYDRIIELHNKIETDGFYDCCCHRFLLVSKKN